MLNSLLLAIRFLILVFSGHKQVALENIALRHQLAVFTREKKRPRLRDRDRLFWIALKKLYKDWRAALAFVQPETVIGWQRKRFKRYWWRLCQVKGPGRPPMSAEIRKLIRTMGNANPLWGAPRIHGELLKLGLEVSERTVSRLMPKRDKEPSQSWKTFLSNHVGQLVSIDFFTVPTVRLRVLFVFVVLAHERRRLLHFNVTEHPTAEWTAQQIIETSPEDTAPRYLIRDRDGVYGSQFRTRVQGMGIQEVLTAARSPWQNPFAERLIGSIRRECLESCDRARRTASEMDGEKIPSVLPRFEDPSILGEGFAKPATDSNTGNRTYRPSPSSRRSAPSLRASRRLNREGERRATIQKRGCAFQVTANIVIVQKAFQTKMDGGVTKHKKRSRLCVMQRCR